MAFLSDGTPGYWTNKWEPFARAKEWAGFT